MEKGVKIFIMMQCPKIEDEAVFHSFPAAGLKLEVLKSTVRRVVEYEYVQTYVQDPKYHYDGSQIIQKAGERFHVT